MRRAKSITRREPTPAAPDHLYLRFAKPGGYAFTARYAYTGAGPRRGKVYSFAGFRCCAIYHGKRKGLLYLGWGTAEQYAREISRDFHGQGRKIMVKPTAGKVGIGIR